MSTTNVALPIEKPMNPALLAQRKRALLRKFTLLQQMNTGKSGNVEIRGTKAGTTGNRTVLPLGNLEDPEYLDMLEGMMDHENGHCKHTDFSVWFAIKHKLVKRLTNIFEDIRIEKLVSHEYLVQKPTYLSWLMLLSNAVCSPLLPMKMILLRWSRNTSCIPAATIT